MKQFTKIIFGYALLLVVSGCYYDNFEELNAGKGTDTSCNDTTGTIAYNSKVKNIMTTYCGTTGGSAAGCHGNGATSGIALVTYSDVVNEVQNNLLSSIKHDGNASNMPKGGGKLTECQILIIEKWINQGTLEN